MIKDKKFSTTECSGKTFKLKEVPFAELPEYQQGTELRKIMKEKTEPFGLFDNERSTEGQVNVAYVVLSELLILLHKKNMLSLEEIDKLMVAARFTSEY